MESEENEDLITENADSEHKSLFATAPVENLFVDQKIATVNLAHRSKEDPDTFEENIPNKENEQDPQVVETDLEYHLSKNFIVSSVPETINDDLFSDNISSKEKPEQPRDLVIDRDSPLFRDVLTSSPQKTGFIEGNSLCHESPSNSLQFRDNADIVKNTFTTTTTEESFKQKPKKPTSGLFDDDIFKNTKVLTKSAPQLKKSLFGDDDDDDDDDIFKSVSSTTIKSK